MLLEAHTPPPETPRNVERKTITLSDYQLSSIMEFPGYSTKEKKTIAYAGLGGILTNTEIGQLRAAFSSVHKEDSTHTFSADILKDLMANTEDPELKKVLKKIRKFIDVEVVTAAHLSDIASFEQLSLHTRFVISQMKQDFFDNAKEELENNTVIVVSRFKKPSPHYLKAIEDTEGESTVEKVTIALENRDEKIKQVSHEFVNVALIPVDNGKDHSNKLHQQTKLLNTRVDENFEGDYAEAILMKTMLTKEMKGALYGMTSIMACMPLLHVLNEHNRDNPVVQSLINFIPPFIADLVTFWGQLAPWLEDETLSKKAIEFGKRLLTGSHRRSFSTSVLTTALGSAGAEMVNDTYGSVPGSIVYGGVPFLVAAITTHDTIRALQKQTGKSYLQTARMMFANNPVHLGIDTGATLTFPTAVGVLGVGGQMNNPMAKALIEGVEEHAIASAFTMLQLYIGQTYHLRRRMEKDLQKWMKKDLIGKNSFKTPSLEQEAPEE